jgi:hypothetical protein
MAAVSLDRELELAAIKKAGWNSRSSRLLLTKLER